MFSKVRNGWLKDIKKLNYHLARQITNCCKNKQLSRFQLEKFFDEYLTAVLIRKPAWKKVETNIEILLRQIAKAFVGKILYR